MISLYVSYMAGRRLELVTPVTALSRPTCVMIMSDFKSCVLFLCKKKIQERMRDLFFPQKFDWF